MTLQLHGGGFAPDEQPKTIPEIDDDAPPRAARASIQTIASISLKTEEFTPEELSFAESLSANDLFSESLSDKAGLVLGDDVGFSLAGGSFHDKDVQPLDLYEQLQAHALRDPLLDHQVGNYRFVEKIGKGGFGAVYRAEQVYLGEPAAIKVLHLHQVDNPETVRRFQREARALAQLRHPSIVKMIDFGMLPQFGFYLVMELLEGDNLYARLRAREPFSIGRLKDIYRQLCDVLYFVHQQGIVHRDLKLSNIFLTPSEDGTEKLTLLDFGIAAIANDIDQITKTGAYIGTATYASPEQIQGAKALDGRSDLYSLGVLLYRLLVGKPPFEGRNAMDITHRKLATKAPSLAALAPSRTWAPSLEAMMVAVLDRDPDQRPQDAMAFWDLCENALTEQAALWNSYTQIDNVAAPDKAVVPAAAQVAKKEQEDVREREGTPIRIERQPNAAISLREDGGAAVLLNAHTLEVHEDDLPLTPKPLTPKPLTPKPLTPPSSNATLAWDVSSSQRAAIEQAVQEQAAEEQDSTVVSDGSDDLASTSLSIGPAVIDLGDTLDQRATDRMDLIDETDSFATIKQAGLSIPSPSLGTMTVETPHLNMALLDPPKGPKGDSKHADTREGAGDAPSGIIIPANEDVLILNAATRPMRIPADSRDTLVNPLNINDMPAVAEAIAAELLRQEQSEQERETSSHDTEEREVDERVLGPKTIKSPHIPAPQDAAHLETPHPASGARNSWGWYVLGVVAIASGLLIFYWSQ